MQISFISLKENGFMPFEDNQQYRKLLQISFHLYVLQEIKVADLSSRTVHKKNVDIQEVKECLRRFFYNHYKNKHIDINSFLIFIEGMFSLFILFIRNHIFILNT